MPQELDDVQEPDEIIEDDLDEIADDDLIEEDAVLVADDVDDDDAVIEVDAAIDVVEPAAPAPAAKAAEDGDEEEEEEPDDEDVEASLDMILKERLVVEEAEEDEETVEPDDRAEGVERVLPKQPDEFVCRSCFLVKHPSQLADGKKMLCRDCV